jgi:nitrite reductase (NADH) large subunit
MKPRLVLIGNGMAGVRTLEELLAIAPDLYEITVFGDEPHGNYNRILLSPVLAGEQTLDEIMLNDRAWYERHGITLHAGAQVVEIDRGRRLVRSNQGHEVHYDRAIVATGSRPIVLPVPGADLDGVVTFRDIQDVERMLEAAQRHRSAAVIGGGLLGLEAAHGLAARGMEVTVVHLLSSLMEKQLDPAAAGLLRASLEARGIHFRLEAQTERVLGRDRATGLRFGDGTELTCDLVVMAVGIRPNKDLAEGAGLPCERGVLVNDTMQTFDPRIYAVGECVQHRGATYGLVAPLFDQGKVVANQLAEDGYYQFRGAIPATRLKVTGIDLFSAGQFQGGDGCEEVVFQDPSRGVYKKVVLKDGRVAGAVLVGDAADGGWYLQLMKEGDDVSALRDGLVFGRAFATQGSAGGEPDVLALPDDAPVCHCNGVCKGQIVSAIREKSLRSLPEVVAHTKAGASCGTCKGTVEQILACTAGDAYERAAVAPVCACTDLGHDELRARIAEGSYATVGDVVQALDWRFPEGCAACRPAINYYLLCAHP